MGGDPGDPVLALVGKGVTFDSGGLSIKPTDGMKTMKCDMAGAATVFGAMQAIARLELPINVIGLAGLVENMIGGDAYKLGDVLIARNGKTIEVLNTDAEGRLVLADVLDVAVERHAAKIIDLATLDGRLHGRLGHRRGGADDERPGLVRRGADGGRRLRRTRLAIAHVRGLLRRADPEQSGRHQERRRRPLGRCDHGRQVPGAIRRQDALGRTSTSPDRPSWKTPSRGWTPAGQASSCGRWSRSHGGGMRKVSARSAIVRQKPGFLKKPGFFWAVNRRRGRTT